MGRVSPAFQVGNLPANAIPPSTPPTDSFLPRKLPSKRPAISSVYGQDGRPPSQAHQIKESDVEIQGSRVSVIHCCIFPDVAASSPGVDTMRRGLFVPLRLRTQYLDNYGDISSPSIEPPPRETEQAPPNVRSRHSLRRWTRLLCS